MDDDAQPFVAPRRSETLTDQVYQQLRMLLLSGAFSPGERISIRKLSARLGISFTPAREALLRLAAQNALVFTETRNVRVPVLDAAQIVELYQIREALEVIMAGTAAPLMTPVILRELAGLQQQMNAVLDRGQHRDALRCNYQFHFQVYRASRLIEMMQIVENIWLRVGPAFNQLYPEYGVSRRGARHHARILAALRKRDSRQAEAALASDIRDGRDELLRNLDRARSVA